MTSSFNLEQRIVALEQAPTGQNEYPRVRINVKQLAKGEERFDCTYEDMGVTWQEAKAKSDELVAALRVSYPAPEVS